jgi:GxxExxY protein
MTDATHAHDPETYAIIGAGHEVVRVLGTGFLERAIVEALAIEFALRKIPFKMEVGFSLEYKGHPLLSEYRADFVCFDSVIVEVKAVNRRAELDQAQMLNYLRASGFKRGLLLNFTGALMTARRFSASDKWQRAGDVIESSAS